MSNELTEETRHRYGRVEARHVSDWEPLTTEPFMCSLTPELVDDYLT